MFLARNACFSLERMYLVIFSRERDEEKRGEEEWTVCLHVSILDGWIGTLNASGKKADMVFGERREKETVFHDP